MPHPPTTPPGRSAYVRWVLDLYRWTPGTCGRVRPADRRLAALLHQRRVSLDSIHAALLLATCRRTFRPPEALPLARIASLNYFLPVIDEILDQPLDPAYVEYLRSKLADLAPALAHATVHRLS